MANFLLFSSKDPYTVSFFFLFLVFYSNRKSLQKSREVLYTLRQASPIAASCIVTVHSQTQELDIGTIYSPYQISSV